MSQLTSTTLGRTTRRVPTAVLALTLAAAVLLVSLGLAIALTPAGAPGVAAPAGLVGSSVMRDGPHLDTRWPGNAAAPVASVANPRGSLDSEYLREISVGWGAPNDTAPRSRLESEYLREISAGWRATRDTVGDRSQRRGIQPR